MKALYEIFASANVQKMLPADFQSYSSNNESDARRVDDVSPWIISVIYWDLLI